MLSFFVGTTPHGVQMMTDMGSYLDFVMILLLAFGLAFEVPIATVLLVWTGFVKIATLKKNRGFVLLGIFIFAAFVTPPDAVSQSCMAVPMYILYEIGILMAKFLLKDKIAARAKEDAEREAQTGLSERHFFRPPARPRHAVLHGNVGALHLLRDARLLVLFLVGAVASGGFGIDDKTAAAIYGLYTSAVYLVALPGGWIADRLIGARRAVLGRRTDHHGRQCLAGDLHQSRAAFYIGLS
jgi:hypothetical protein